MSLVVVVKFFLCQRPMGVRGKVSMENARDEKRLRGAAVGGRLGNLTGVVFRLESACFTVNYTL
jgi:hypothetical protein